MFDQQLFGENGENELHTLDRLAIRLLIRCITFDGVRVDDWPKPCRSSVFSESYCFVSLLLVDGRLKCFCGVGLVSVDCVGVAFSELLDELKKKKNGKTNDGHAQIIKFICYMLTLERHLVVMESHLLYYNHCYKHW